MSFSNLAERKGRTWKFKGASSLYITVNKDDAGVIREVFVNTTASGSTTHGLCEALGRTISVALQDDYPAERIAHTLSGIISDSTWTHARFGQVFSIPSAIAQVINAEMEEDENE